MKCAECSKSAMRCPKDTKTDASRRAMAKAGFIACMGSFATASFMPAMKERQCAAFAPLDADKAKARVEWFVKQGVVA